MEHERDRNSRASSTSSLGREVRCACQYFQSDSLLPERRAIIQQYTNRPSSRMEQKILLQFNTCEHEYEPVDTSRLNKKSSHAPVVRIIDTDVVPVADSDDSIDTRGRFNTKPILDDDDLVLPLDGQIEDNAMEARELGSGYISEEIETVQKLQDRVEDRFSNAIIQCTEFRTDGEVNTSHMSNMIDSSAMDELPSCRDALGLPQRLRFQASKLRSRLKNIQRPNFPFPIERNRSRKSRTSVKSKSRSSNKSSEKSRSLQRSEKPLDKHTRIEKIRASLPERPKFLLLDRSKLRFSRESKFHFPKHPKINIPKIPTQSSFHLPTLFHLPSRRQRAPTLGEQQHYYSNESNASSRKNLFDFATVPRLFNKKKKNQNDFATSSPKKPCAKFSPESATLPRLENQKQSFLTRSIQSKINTQRFTDIKFADDDDEFLSELERPWGHQSFEQPRRSIHAQDSLEDSEPLPWEKSESRQKRFQTEERVNNDELNEQENQRNSNNLKDFYDPPQIDPRLYGDQNIVYEETQKQREDYRVAFGTVNPRRNKIKHSPSTEEESETKDEVHISSESDEDLSARSDREQQPSSGSSYDRRRCGVVEEIESDQSSLRAKGASQDDMHMKHYLMNERGDASKTPPMNALADAIKIREPKLPQMPVRIRSIEKYKESLHFYNDMSLVELYQTLRRSEESNYESKIHDNESISESRHRIVYHAESVPLDLNQIKPLDDIVVVKPIRRKSRTSLRSTSLMSSESIEEEVLEYHKPPPIVPRRRKRRFQDMKIKNYRIYGAASHNGHHPFLERESISQPKSEPPMRPSRGISHDRISVGMKLDDGKHNSRKKNFESAPVAPKRHSRSRATSVVQDDDRTSRAAESIPDICYIDDEEPRDDGSQLNFPGYAIIDKCDKPPRPPPPRRQRGGKFSTTPRTSPPKRPVRTYSTLRPKFSTPSKDKMKTQHKYESAPYIEINSDIEGDHKNIRSGEIQNKMAGRPLPAPPRPPRARRQKITDEHEENIINDNQTILQYLSTKEAFASTQTDPLPDDLVIEEEITQAKLVVTPSRSGSRIMISTERIPSPQYFRSNVQAISHERIPSQMPELYVGLSTRSEPDIRACRETSQRGMRIPKVPPLPTSKAIYSDINISQRPTRRSSSFIPCDVESKIPGIKKLEERLSAFLTNETLKIGSLEVGDLKVDKLNVSSLEAHKIAASEIDAIIMTAAEISNAGEEKNALAIHPSLLQELIAIKNQLQLVTQREVAQSKSSSKTDVKSSDPRTDLTLIGIEPLIEETSIYPETPHSSLDLQSDAISKTTQCRSIYSTQSILPQKLHQISSQNTFKSKLLKKKIEDEIDHKQEEKSRCKSRSCSPTRPIKRETASPVRSLPPVISVTPDTPVAVQQLLESIEFKPQRATISYSSEIESSEHPSPVQSRPSSPQTHPASPLMQTQQYIAFQTSYIPPQFFTLTSSQNAHAIPNEASVLDMTQQLIRALRLAGKKAMRHFIGYIVSRVTPEESEAKIREIELAICALLLIIVGLLIVCFAGPKTINHHYHWDYFNPPQL